MCQGVLVTAPEQGLSSIDTDWFGALWGWAPVQTDPRLCRQSAVPKVRVWCLNWARLWFWDSSTGSGVIV